MPQNPAITISRSLGSGGTEAGFLAARQLGWHFCDRRILRLAAQTLGCSSTALAHQEERHCGFLEQLKTVIAYGSPEAPYTPILDMPIYSKDLYAVEKEVILKMVEHAPSVIVGRGGFIALRNRPATLHVSIHTDMAWRIQSLVQRGKAPDPQAAKKAILASDRDRAAFIRNLSGQDWHDPKLFDLVLDIARIGPEACVQQLLEAARHLS
jgi:hypothetical protein